MGSYDGFGTFGKSWFISITRDIVNRDDFKSMTEEKKKVGGGIGVVLFRDGKFLFGKRHDDLIKADSALRGEGTWCIPGGKLDFRESFEEGAKREVLEETGIKINKIEVICVSNEENQYAHFITVGLFSDDFDGDPQVLEPDEITKWEWFSPDNLPSPIFIPSGHVLENYLKKRFYYNWDGPSS